MQLTRWLGPAILALLVMLGYQLIVSPIVRDWLDDWAYLHAARMFEIQRQIQKQAPAK